MTETISNSNGAVGNGHAVQPQPEQQPTATESEIMQRIRAFILTIYDIIIFLGVSIGYISEVSLFSLSPRVASSAFCFLRSI